MNYNNLRTRLPRAAVLGVALAFAMGAAACDSDVSDPMTETSELSVDDSLDVTSPPSCDGAWSSVEVVTNIDGYQAVAGDPMTRTFALMTPHELELWSVTATQDPFLRDSIPASELGTLARWEHVIAAPCEGGFVALGSAGLPDARATHVAMIHRVESKAGPTALRNKAVLVDDAPDGPGDLKTPPPSLDSPWEIQRSLELESPGALVASRCDGALAIAGAEGVTFVEPSGDELYVTSRRGMNDPDLGAVTALALVDDTAVVGLSSRQLALVSMRPSGPMRTLATRATPRQPLVLGDSLLIPETSSGWGLPVDPQVRRDGELPEQGATDPLAGPEDLTPRTHHEHPEDFATGPTPSPDRWAGFELVDVSEMSLTEFGEAPIISAFDAHDGPFAVEWLNGQLVVANSESGLLSGRLDGAGVGLDESTALTAELSPGLPARPQSLAGLDDVVVTLEPGRAAAAFVGLCQ